MPEYDYDLNTAEATKKLACSPTSLTAYVKQGKLSRVPKNPNATKGRGSGWLYSSQEIDGLVSSWSDEVCEDGTTCKGKCATKKEPKKSGDTFIVHSSSATTQNISAAATTVTIDPIPFPFKKKPWWKRFF